MPAHIGIVACSAEGAALCFRTICSEGAPLLGAHAHPEVSMHAHSLAEYVDALNRGDLERVAALMLASSHKLAAAGAELLICPDNTIHQAMPQVMAASPLPWLHIVDVVADEAQRRGFRRLGILGTSYLVESSLYPERLTQRGIECVVPTRDACRNVHGAIMNELVHGTFDPQTTAMLERVIADLKDAGCDSVALACTELPLVLSDANSSLPVLDSTRLLARAALSAATGHRTAG
jgi:aspartate racemase